MPVVYGSPDLLASLSVVYVCRCGARAGEYGLHAGEVPTGWVRVADGEYACPHCARSVSTSTGAAPGEPPAATR